MSYTMKDSKGPSAAAHKVFGITELLEAILLQLPIEDQFAIQQVCANFKDVIRGSISIQTAMFMTNAATKELWFEPTIGWTGQASGPQPIYDGKQIEPRHILTPRNLRSRLYRARRGITGTIVVPFKPNPLIFSKHKNQNGDANLAYDVSQVRLRTSSRIYRYLFTRSPCPDMFLTRPAVTEIMISMGWAVPQSSNPPKMGSCIIRNSNGLRMSHFVEAVEKSLRLLGADGTGLAIVNTTICNARVPTKDEAEWMQENTRKWNGACSDPNLNMRISMRDTILRTEGHFLAMSDYGEDGRFEQSFRFAPV